MARARSTAAAKQHESVEETIEAAEGLEPGNIRAVATVQSTTEVTPTEADETPMPNALNTDPNTGFVRTARPDVPIAQTLVAGAGEHTPPDPDEFDKDGRPRSVSDGSAASDAAVADDK